MTRQTTERLKSHWPLIVMIASIFVSGWLVREALSSEIDAKVKQVERRFQERLATMQEDVRDIRNYLIEKSRRETQGPP